MKIHSKKLEFKILKSMLISYVLLVSLILLIVIYGQNRSFESKNSSFHRVIHSSIHYLLEHNKKHYHTILKKISKTKDLNKYIINNDRENLYKILKYDFELLKEENKYFNVLHIIKPNGQSLLRVHKKDKYGDNLFEIRPMIREVIKNKKIISGYETGKYATVYRIIMPIFDKNKFIAMLEIGINPNYFINQIDSILNEKGMLFIKKDNLKLFSKNNNHKINDYILQTEIGNNTSSILNLIPNSYTFEDNYQINDGQNRYLLHTHTLHKYSNEEYGRYVFIQDISHMLVNQKQILFQIFILLTFLLIILYFIVRYYFIKFETKLEYLHEKHIEEVTKLKIAIENAPISIVITDIDGNLEYVNNYFTKVTGYTYAEAIGENPKILKTGYTSIDEYQSLWDDISSDHTWRGTFKNKKKNGEEYWEEAIIVPIEDKNKKVVKYLGIKQEVTEAIHLRSELKNKDELLLSQSKHAAMGEMISMIAHQWRQPLSIISMGANNILADIELDLMDKNEIKNEMNEIISQTQELSQTIDDFRNFFKPTKSYEIVTLKNILDDTFKVINKSLENNNVIININNNSNKKIKTYPRELMQVFINILNNAKEALIQTNPKERNISISIFDQDDSIIITLCDNAGGIKKDTISKIFNPYFSTKHAKSGTGLGLYISKTIIEKHLNGTIRAYNKNNGACFVIEISDLKDTNE